MQKIIWICIGVACVVTLSLYVQVDTAVQERNKSVLVTVHAPQKKWYKPTHAQRTWISALEWCESAGKPTSINPNDSDGKPSYYSFQFRPDTFKMYALRYGLFTKEELSTQEKVFTAMKEHSNQYRIVSEMINDNRVRWKNEFPLCMKKIGLPPRY